MSNEASNQVDNPSEQDRPGRRDPREAGYHGMLFELFVRTIAPSMVDGGKTTIPAPGLDPGVDAIVQDSDGTIWLIEARGDDPSTSQRLRAVVAQLKKAAQVFATGQAPHLVLAIPGRLSEQRAELVAEAGITLWDGPMLAAAAAAAGVDIPRGLGIHRWIKPAGSPAVDLRQRLTNISAGHPSWVAFQAWVADVLAYLFCPPLADPLLENSTDNGHNRRDIVLPNYAQHGMWAFLRLHYRADFVVVDAKNSGAHLKKDVVLQLANYLSSHGAGLFGLVICRRGADKGARWTIREQWVLHNKLIIVLNIEDVLQMLTAKESGNDPAALIKQRIEDFRLGL